MSTTSERLAAIALLWTVTGCASTMDKARSAHERGAYEEAETLYNKAANDAKTASDAQIGMAALHVDLAQQREDTDPQGAEAHYRDALELRPVDEDALTGLVRLLRRVGRLQDAGAAVQSAEATGECGFCGRLALVVLLERGDQAFAAKDWAIALGHYAAAQALREQAAVAVAIAATHLGVGALAETEAALIAAQPQMVGANDSAVERFVQVRRALIDSVLADPDLEAADRIRAIRLAKEPAARDTELAILVADRVYAAGDKDDALARYDALLAAGGDALNGPQRAAMAKKVADVYAQRGTVHLHAGEAEAADQQLQRAIELQPEDWGLKLQRILALSSSMGAAPAIASLSQVPTDTVGLAHARAILMALRVREQVAAGDIEAARESLVQAQKAHPDLPEVHLAAAFILARSPAEDLNSRDRRALLGRKSLVPYEDEVYRYGEALSEVEWVRTQVEQRGADYPFTAPWLKAATTDLDRGLKAVYPHTVAFRADPEPLIVFANEGDGFIEISIAGPDGLRDEVGIAPGDTREVQIPDSGVLRLRIGRDKRVFYAEGYAKVTIDVP